MSTRGQGFGVDIGGSGIKGALVDLDAGALDGDRYRVETPVPSTPEAVAGAVADVVDHFGWTGAFGATFPAVIARGVARTAANVDASWIGTDVADTLTRPGHGRVTVLNDADAAGLAEVRFGAARDVPGVTLVVTLGTGIGTALFVDGTLVPNTELGHLELDGHEAERRASDAARERHDLSWEHWAERVERYLRHLEDLLWPDLLVVGGGVSRKADKWLPHVTTRTRLVPAQLQNGAGIVGAALAAAEATPEPDA